MGYASENLKSELFHALEADNQRKHERFQIEDTRHWQMKVNHKHFHVFWLKDLSASGIQLRQSVRKPVAGGDTMRVELRFHGKEFLTKTASVKWVRKDPEHVNMNIVGLEFVSPEGRELSSWKTNFSKKNLVSCDEEFVKSQVTAVEDLKRQRFQMSELAWILCCSLPFLAGYISGYLG